MSAVLFTDDYSTVPSIPMINEDAHVFIIQPLHDYRDTQCGRFYKRERDYPTLRESIRKRR